MADEAKSTKSKVLKKKTETLRQRTERATEAAGKHKSRRIRKTAGAVSKPFRAAHRIGKKEYYLPLPDNRIGRFLNKRRSAMPRFFIEAWRELRQVEWPTFGTVRRLTIAVFVFALFFGTLIAVVDFGLDKVFRKVFVD